MKKLLALAALALVLVPALVLVGCGGDDDPGTPGETGCSLTLTAPTGGASYLAGEELRIRWEQEGSATVQVDLLKGGDFVANIASVLGREQYGWNAVTMGAASGDDFAIRLTADGVDGCGDTSEEFEIIDASACDFNFTVEENQAFAEGDDFLITWNSQSTTGLVEIELWRMDDNDFPVGLIAADVPNTGSFHWSVDSLHAGTYNYYYLKIRDSRVPSCGAASLPFRIVDSNLCSILANSPQPAAVWTEGETRQVQFTAPDDATTEVNISLYQGLVYCNTIAQRVPVTHDIDSVDWVVTSAGAPAPGHTFRIKFTDANDNYCVGWSGDFTIADQ